MQGWINCCVIYLVVLFYDIGKGWVEDYLIFGVWLVWCICICFGLFIDEIEIIEWLICNYLLMLDVVQKCDIVDFCILCDFVKVVKSMWWLELLLVLIVCDICGVGFGIWNNWKVMLLCKLYVEIECVLKSGFEEINCDRCIGEVKCLLCYLFLVCNWDVCVIKVEFGCYYDNYWLGLFIEMQVVFVELLCGLGDDQICIDLYFDIDCDVICVVFVLVDYLGIFLWLVGVLVLVGVNVVDVCIYMMCDGFVIVVFWLQDGDGYFYDVDCLFCLCKMIECMLLGEIVVCEVLVGCDKLKKCESVFCFLMYVNFDNEVLDVYIVIEVDICDWFGLFYDLMWIFVESYIQIVSVVIVIFGVQVVDIFYVKDMFGLKLYQQQCCDILFCKL